jgi:hypothetical protein
MAADITSPSMAALLNYLAVDDLVNNYRMSWQ